MKNTLALIILLIFAFNPSAEKTQHDKIYYIELDDDGTDQTLNLQRQLDAIPNGTEDAPVHIKLPEGKFWTEGKSSNVRGEGSGVTILRNRNYLVIDGTGTTFYTKAPAYPFEGGNVWKGKYSHRRHFCIWDSDNIEIKGLRIEGSNAIPGRQLGTTPELTPEFWKGGPDKDALPGFPAYTNFWEFEHGFDIRSSENITLKDCEVDSVWGDGYYVGRGSTYTRGRSVLGRQSNNISIIDCSVRFNGRMGMATNDCKNLLVENLTVDHSRMSGIDLEPDSADGVIDGVEIKNCNIRAQLYAFPAGGRGDISNVNIHHNTYSGGSLYLRTVSPQDLIIRKNWKFTDNERIGRGGGQGSPIKVVWVDNIEIARNIDAYAGPDYIRITAARGVKIYDNVLDGKPGLRTAWVEDLEVHGNSPELIQVDESHLTTQEGIDLYNKMKQADQK